MGRIANKGWEDREEVQQLARLIKERRDELGWKQDELGQRVGLGTARISQIERGDLSLPFFRLLDLLEVLKLRIEIGYNVEGRDEKVDDRSGAAGVHELAGDGGGSVGTAEVGPSDGGTDLGQ